MGCVSVTLSERRQLQSIAARKSGGCGLSEQGLQSATSFGGRMASVDTAGTTFGETGGKTEATEGRINTVNCSETAESREYNSVRHFLGGLARSALY